MANVWMHNGFLQVEGEKMSKSLGNFVTISGTAGAIGRARCCACNMLKTHYRSPIDWTREGTGRKRQDARRLVSRSRPHADGRSTPSACRDRSAVRRSQHAADDRGAARLAQRRRCPAGWRDRGAFSSIACGCSASSPQTRMRTWKSRNAAGERHRSKQVESLIADRAAARARKDFKESDRIRDELAAMGVVLKDGKGCRRQAGDHLGDRAMTKPDTPFPRHWRYYIFIKWAVIVAAIAAGPETVRSVLTRWHSRCRNMRCGRSCRRIRRRWRRSSLPPFRN